MSGPPKINRDLNTRAIHKHLQTQFSGVIIKLTQEIDTLTQSKQEVETALRRLQTRLNMACSAYCGSNPKNIHQSVEDFYQTCQNALNDYRSCPKIQKTLQHNDISQETIDNMFTRFSEGIQSAIYYTLNHSCMPKNEHQKLSSAYQLFGALGNRLKQWGNKEKQLSDDDDNSPQITL